MTSPAATISPEQRTDLRQLAGAAPFALWVKLYAESDVDDGPGLSALISRNGGNLRLAAADLLDGLIDGEETIKKLKLDGELELEFLPVQYATKSASLRAQVAEAGALGHRFGPPVAGMMVGRSQAPQAFVLGSEAGPPDRERLGGLPVITDRETP